MTLKKSEFEAQRKLTIYYVNINGLTKLKMQRITKILNTTDIGLIGLIETWSDDWEIPLSDDYELFSNDCIKNKGLGRNKIGLMILAKKELGFKQVRYDSPSTLMIENSKTLFILYYRHRLGLGMEFLDEETLERYCNKQTIVAADMNFSEKSAIEREIRNLLGDNGITEISFPEPTYYKGTLKSKPDKVYSNIELKVEVLKHCKALSDHTMIAMTHLQEARTTHNPTVGTKAFSNDAFVKKYKGDLFLLFSKIDLTKIQDALSINKLDVMIVGTIMSYIKRQMREI